MTKRPYVAGNWKMNLAAADALRLASEVVRTTARHRGVDVGIIPSFPFMMGIAPRLEGSALKLGAQDVDACEFGARTSAVNAEQALSAGAVFTLVGHSERRSIFADSDADCSAKLRAALDAGLEVMLCIGETESERDQGTTQAVVERQLAGGLETVRDEEWTRISLAYEPVWAIGTGRTATPDQAEQAHAWVRGWLEGRASKRVAADMRILYGGSVKPANASELLAREGIDGALVGGASLDAVNFAAIVAAAASSRS
jgi:triosephosphate isomerase